MQQKALITIIFLTFLAFNINAQSSGNSRDPKPKEISDEEAIKIFMATRKSESRLMASEKCQGPNETINAYYDRLISEHHIRIQQNIEQKKITEKLKEQPKYSDPSYFGHDNKPKKRKRGKRRYCIECGIIH
ncbi:hypothetical protein [Marinigracilibium pacificum]|uniref:Uncharacterized protein n=1 Tax=Marinigracilibium pacificum TaxID=2729599 RepID=A0A848J1P9_9BACT|nr:hypothetical protein [Marinigracilibium pacificum]NMM49726.1 hypothetical protein [Marinigracilibium pacificum]